MECSNNQSIGIYLKNLLSRKFLLVVISFSLLIINAVMDFGIDEWSIVSITAGFVAGNGVEHIANKNKNK